MVVEFYIPSFYTMYIFRPSGYKKIKKASEKSLEVIDPNPLIGNLRLKVGKSYISENSSI